MTYVTLQKATTTLGYTEVWGQTLKEFLSPQQSIQEDLNNNIYKIQLQLPLWFINQRNKATFWIES